MHYLMSEGHVLLPVAGWQRLKTNLPKAIIERQVQVQVQYCFSFTDHVLACILQ